jgi:hypothetical protein
MQFRGDLLTFWTSGLPTGSNLGSHELRGQVLINALTGQVGTSYYFSLRPLVCHYGRASESVSSTLRAVAASSLFTSS